MLSSHCITRSGSSTPTMRWSWATPMTNWPPSVLANATSDCAQVTLLTGHSLNSVWMSSHRSIRACSCMMSMSHVPLGSQILQNPQCPLPGGLRVVPAQRLVVGGLVAQGDDGLVVQSLGHTAGPEEGLRRTGVELLDEGSQGRLLTAGQDDAH